MRKTVILFFALCGLIMEARGQTIDLSGFPQETTASQLRYWFNDDVNIQTTNTLSGSTTIDASTLAEGIHIVHYQVVDNLGVASIPVSKIFIKTGGTPTTAASLRYWFNSDAKSVKTTDIASGVTTIDASALVAGIHTIHYQVIDNQGVAGITASKMFFKTGASTTTAASLRYWFDSDSKSVKSTDIASGVTTIDASALAEGLHTVHYQVVDNQGVAGITASKIFVKTGGTATTAASLRYWFDEDAKSMKTTEIGSGATIIDASALMEGEHVIHYQVVDNQGVAGVTVSKAFIKNGPMKLTLTAIQDPESPTDYWMTFYSDLGNFVPDASTTVYKATLSDDNTKLLMTEVEDHIVNTSTAVILKSTSPQIVLLMTTDASGDTNNNDLLGGITVASGYEAYTLLPGSGGTDPIGFHKSDGTTLDGNTAHVELPSASSGDIEVIVLVIDDGTGINTLHANPDLLQGDGAWYTLDGRKLDGAPTKKGIYIYKGKKVLIKR